MTEQERLLVPLDGSALAETALPYAEALARSLDGSLHLLAVVEREPGGPFSLAPEIRDQLVHGMLAESDTYLATMAQQSRSRGVAVHWETVETIAGHAAEEILAAAGRMDADMIVMATHGRGGLQRLFLGSVADKVMRTGSQPTLLISPRDDASVQHTIALRRIAVPLDGSPLAEAALAPATRLAAMAEARLVLLRVQSLPLTTTMAYAYVPDLSAVEAELEHCR
jgi:nucleotide-binding universal stress UspA family protein